MAGKLPTPHALSQATARKMASLSALNPMLTTATPAKRHYGSQAAACLDSKKLLTNVSNVVIMVICGVQRPATIDCGDGRWHIFAM